MLGTETLASHSWATTVSPIGKPVGLHLRRRSSRAQLSSSVSVTLGSVKPSAALAVESPVFPTTTMKHVGEPGKTAGVTVGVDRTHGQVNHRIREDTCVRAGSEGRTSPGSPRRTSPHCTQCLRTD